MMDFMSGKRIRKEITDEELVRMREPLIESLGLSGMVEFLEYTQYFTENIKSGLSYRESRDLAVKSVRGQAGPKKSIGQVFRIRYRMTEQEYDVFKESYNRSMDSGSAKISALNTALRSIGRES